jgi:ligand-binding SRPBCC domain-containing protein
MPIITLETRITADIETCFDLSRSIDLHQISTAQTHEKAIAGTISGLIDLGETVTWEAKHFGMIQQLTSKITAMNRPFHFRDEQVKGVFRSIIHDHFLEQQGDVVMMKDTFRFESPCGFAGRIFNNFFLKRYLTKILAARNEVIRNYAENGKAQEVLQIPKRQIELEILEH